MGNVRLRLICAKEDADEAAQAHALTKNIRIGERKALLINDKVCIITRSAAEKRVIVVSGGFDFTFNPVASALPPDPDDVRENYRNGVSGVRVTESTADEHPLLSVGDRLPGRLVMHATINKDTDVVAYTPQLGVCGTSTWYGDSPNVISWHGIGSMDACGNDYREFSTSAAGTFYTQLAYERTYYPRRSEAYTAPDSAFHLFGDRYFTVTEPELGYGSHCAVYRNGKRVAVVPWPVTAACEVMVDDKPRLRVLCVRWFVDPIQTNLVQGNPDLFFEAYSFTGFYLYDEREDGTFDVKIIEVPYINPITLSNESILAQAPHFSADGSVCAGILETGLGAATSKYYWQDFGSKNVHAAVAYVFSIDCATAVCTLAQPACVAKIQRDAAAVVDSRYEHVETKQTLCVYPTAGGQFTTMIRTDSKTVTKSHADSEATQYANDEYVWRGGTEAIARAANIQTVIDITAACLPLLQAWYLAENGAPVTSNQYVSFQSYGNSYLDPDLDHTYSEYTYPGSSGVQAPLWSVGLLNGDLYSPAAYTSAYLADLLERYQVVYGNITPDQDGVIFNVNGQATYRTQTTVRTQDIGIDGASIVSGAETSVDVTAGRDVGFAGPGLVFRYINQEFFFDGKKWPKCVLSVDRTLGWSRAYPASNTTAAPMDKVRVAAADMRKGAAVIKNNTQNTYLFHGVRNTQI